SAATLPATALAVLVAAGAVRARTAAALLVAWLPVAALLGGVPLSALAPRAWDDGAASLLDGLRSLADPAGGVASDDGWARAAAVLVTGVLWTVAAVLSRRRERAATTLALVLAALPLVAALALEHVADAAWPGAVLLAAAVLWIARGRLRTLAPLTAVVAAAAAVGGQAVGPEEQWLPFVDAAGRPPQFTRLDTTQGYGPLPDRRTGRTMAELTAPAPGLWRMQVLERFSNGWSVRLRERPELPQPAALTTETTVRYAGLRDELVPAPGRIVGVEGRDVVREDGEARRLDDEPREGDVLRVRAEVVRATAAQLSRVPMPEPGEYADWTRIWGDGEIRRNGRPAIELIEGIARGDEATDFQRVLRIATDLTRGARTQLELVRRVRAYLLDPERFRYTTDVPEAGPQPLYDFLLHRRSGYCQQFAGGAAALLRMAGVPTRVVTGFATGEASGDGTYVVRDRDAHAWIEVYFEGFGWVPFDPTPADTDARVDGSVDALAAAAPSGAAGGGPGAAILLVPVLLLGTAGVLHARRRRAADPATATPTAEVLAGLVPGPIGPATTMAGLRPRLALIGPEVVALADRVERARWSGDAPVADRHPRLRVWRALRRDVGAVRAVGLLARARAAGGRSVRSADR
ncbi:transglutaminase family protein, partial [Patulibacter sp.]|uniref:transglutaminase-like domain-containing protein n=1 Tax=Patulibacter sp. TaxID=1912859 RepID=UPI00271AE560